MRVGLKLGGASAAAAAVLAAAVPGGASPTVVAAGEERLRNGRIAYAVYQRQKDGRFFAFVRTVRPDGSRSRTLPCATPAGDGGCSDADPVYSHDGRRLATSGFETPGVAIRTTRGDVLREIDETGPVTWSPGRRYLALSTAPLRLLDLRDGRSRSLRGDASNAVAWSRQGSLLFGPGPRLDRGDFVVREPSGGRKRILKNSDAESPIDWAPSGRRFAYSDDGIRVASKDGTRRRLVTKKCSPYGQFAWSPDGKEIACDARLGLGPRKKGLIAVNIRTKRLRVIVPGALRIGAIDWQPRRPGS